MSFLSLAPVGIVLAAALLLSRPGSGPWGRRVGLIATFAAIVVTAVLFQSGRTGSSGTFDGDPLSSFVSLVLLASILIAFVSRASGSTSPARLLTGGALAIVAVSTRDLLVASVAIELYVLVSWESGREGFLSSSLLGALTFGSVGLVAWSTGGTDLAAISVAASGAAGPGLLRSGLVLFTISIVATWLVQSRRALRFSRSDLVSGMVSSFSLLAVVVTLLLRLAAWLPDEAPLETFRILALLGLGVGALGMLGATRISTFLTALALERAGASIFGLLGGVHGRVPLLVELVATGASLLLVALALELAAEDGKTPFALDDLTKVVSFPVRITLLVGAFAAAPLPPFPGFFARLASSSAVLLSGNPWTVAVVVALTFLVGVGSMRLVARTWESSSQTSISKPPVTSVGAVVVGLGLVLAAVWAFVVAPGPMVDLATRAATGIF